MEVKTKKHYGVEIPDSTFIDFTLLVNNVDDYIIILEKFIRWGLEYIEVPEPRSSSVLPIERIWSKEIDKICNRCIEIHIHNLGYLSMAQKIEVAVSLEYCSASPEEEKRWLASLADIKDNYSQFISTDDYNHRTSHIMTLTRPIIDRNSVLYQTPAQLLFDTKYWHMQGARSFEE